MSYLQGKVALVTGGSKGIGRATAILLAGKGCQVAISYSSNSETANSTLAALATDNGIAIKADAGRVSDIDRLIKETVDHFGKIDILVCNAAALEMNELATTSEELFDRMIAVNVKGPFFLIQRTLPHMRAGSHVVLMSTTQCHASTVTPPYVLYNMTKGAVEQMTRVLAKDLGRKQIAVNAVAPGPTETAGFAGGKSPELIRTIASWSPQNRLGQPEEVAEAVVFLCESQWVSGQTLRVNGGMA